MIDTCVLLLALMGWVFWFRFGERETIRISFGLAVALVWLLITCSRPISLWFGGDANASSGALEDGNPLNRQVGIVLMTLGTCVLFSRGLNVPAVICGNPTYSAFLVLTLLSILWSDYPSVSLKRWIRHLGTVIFVLVILSDRGGFQAAIRVVRYLAFILHPLSILLFKYMPGLGRTYHIHSGELMITGVTTHKNTLGMLSMFTALFLFQSLHQSWSSGSKKVLYGDMCLLTVSLYLLYVSSSSTALIAFVLAVLYYASFHSARWRKWLTPSCFVLVLVACLAAPFGYNQTLGNLLEYTGKADTFWGRTELWKKIIPMVESHLVGCGYDGFWLGKRLEELWSYYWWKPTQCHNGFLEIFTQVGFLGIGIFTVMVFMAYKRIFHEADPYAALKLAALAGILFYNVTEGGFLGLHPMWFLLLLAAIRYRSQEFSQPSPKADLLVSEYG